MGVGPSMEQLLRDKESLLQDAVIENGHLDKENSGLRAKVNRLEKEVDFISKDWYALVRENCILQNKLGDFNSWPEFRIEFDELATQFEAMKRARATEHISQEQILHIAKEAKLELAATKRAEATSKTAHSEELKLVKQERDDAREMYQTLLATNTAPAIVTTTAASEGLTPGDKALQEKNTRLNLALRSKTSLLSSKTSELERMQSPIEFRSDHSASQLKTAESTILSLEEEKTKAKNHIAKLEKDLQEAIETGEEWEEMWRAAVFVDDEEAEAGAAAGGSGVDEDGSEDEDDYDEEDDDDDEGEEDGGNEYEEDEEE